MNNITVRVHLRPPEITSLNCTRIKCTVICRATQLTQQQLRTRSHPQLNKPVIL